MAEFCRSNEPNSLTEILFTSISRGEEMGCIQALLQEGADIDARDSEGRTPLLIACLDEQKRIANLLIKSGANVDCCDKNKCTVLHYASENGWKNIVQCLVKKKIDLNARDRRGETALHIASITGRLKVAKCLVRAGADMNSTNIVNFTPLICAAQCSNKCVFNFLLESGANTDNTEALLLYYASQNGWTEIAHSFVKKVPDLNEKYVEGETDLDASSETGHLEVVKFLLGEGTGRKKWYQMVCRAALLDASSHGYLEEVEYLVKRISDINVQVCSGETALHHASSESEFEIVKCLVDAGADVNIRDENGETALFNASRDGDLKLVKYLVEKGSDVNIRDSIGNTTLHLAASNEHHIEIVKYLVRNGADTNARNYCDENPLLEAASSQNKNVVHLLIHFERNLNAFNQQKETLLHLVSANGWVDTVQFLIKEKCDLDAQTVCGDTALARACCNHRLETSRALLRAGASWDIEDKDGSSPMDYFIMEDHPEFIRLLFEYGAYIKSDYYDALVEDSKLELLQDENLCHQSILNKFNNCDLPKLYKLPVSRRLPLFKDMTIVNDSEVGRTIQRSVAFDIQRNGHCNIFDVRPMALCVLSARSVLDYYENKKSESSNRSATFDSNDK